MKNSWIMMNTCTLVRKSLHQICPSSQQASRDHQTRSENQWRDVTSARKNQDQDMFGRPKNILCRVSNNGQDNDKDGWNNEDDKVEANNREKPF